MEPIGGPQLGLLCARFVRVSAAVCTGCDRAICSALLHWYQPARCLSEREKTRETGSFELDWIISIHRPIILRLLRTPVSSCMYHTSELNHNSSCRRRSSLLLLFVVAAVPRSVEHTNLGIKKEKRTKSGRSPN